MPKKKGKPITVKPLPEGFYWLMAGVTVPRPDKRRLGWENLPEVKAGVLFHVKHHINRKVEEDRKRLCAEHSIPYPGPLTDSIELTPCGDHGVTIQVREYEDAEDCGYDRAMLWEAISGCLEPAARSVSTALMRTELEFISKERLVKELVHGGWLTQIQLDSAIDEILSKRQAAHERGETEID